MKKILYCLIPFFVFCMENLNAQTNKDTLYVKFDSEYGDYSIVKLYPVQFFLMETTIDSLIDKNVILDLYVELGKNEQNDSIYLKEIKMLYFNIMPGQISDVFKDGILCTTKHNYKNDFMQKFYSDVEYFVKEFINTFDKTNTG